MCLHCLIRQEVSALRADFVRRQAEEEAYYTQQVEIIFQRSSICETQSLHSSLLYCFDLNAGSSAKGRGAAQKHPGTRGRKTNATEEKVKSTTPAHILNYVVSGKKRMMGFIRIACRHCSVLCRLAAMKRELKVKELQLLDATRRRFLKHQQDLRTSQIKRLDQEIGRKVTTAFLTSHIQHVCYCLFFIYVYSYTYNQCTKRQNPVLLPCKKLVK